MDSIAQRILELEPVAAAPVSDGASGLERGRRLLAEIASGAASLQQAPRQPEKVNPESDRAPVYNRD